MAELVKTFGGPLVIAGMHYDDIIDGTDDFYHGVGGHKKLYRTTGATVGWVAGDLAVIAAWTWGGAALGLGTPASLVTGAAGFCCGVLSLVGAAVASHFAADYGEKRGDKEDKKIRADVVKRFRIAIDKVLDKLPDTGNSPEIQKLVDLNRRSNTQEASNAYTAAIDSLALSGANGRYIVHELLSKAAPQDIAEAKEVEEKFYFMAEKLAPLKAISNIPTQAELDKIPFLKDDPSMKTLVALLAKGDTGRAYIVLHDDKNTPQNIRDILSAGKLDGSNSALFSYEMQKRETVIPDLIKRLIEPGTSIWDDPALQSSPNLKKIAEMAKRAQELRSPGDNTWRFEGAFKLTMSRFSDQEIMMLQDAIKKFPAAQHTEATDPAAKIVQQASIIDSGETQSPAALRRRDKLVLATAEQPLDKVLPKVIPQSAPDYFPII